MAILLVTANSVRELGVGGVFLIISLVCVIRMGYVHFVAFCHHIDFSVSDKPFPLSDPALFLLILGFCVFH